MHNSKTSAIEGLPLGVYHSLELKLFWANRLYEMSGRVILQVPAMASLMAAYDDAIARTWIAMRSLDVVSHCTDCALNDGGSCCGKGIEDHFDVPLLLINRLMGVTLPAQRWNEHGCWFLGPQGCLIKARHTLCVNYICKRLQSALSHAAVIALSQATVDETDAGFRLEEAIKKWLMNSL
ncbi:MAG: hypothetical protein ABWK15_02540 [Dissulfuribacterales bacterium]